MGYLALYRQYRPTNFKNLIGQDYIVKTLINQIETGRLGHAYLFTGTRGTGKTTAAKIFAKAINCLSHVDGSPCGKCEACLALSDPSNIDVIEIDAASNNGVNEIRDLREKVQYPPVSCKYKVYIIDEVHMLTGAAFNALLKTLEEPPKHAVFILATTEVHKIPATILSRCMRFDFKLVPTEQIAELIKGIYKAQGKDFEEEAVLAIAKAGEGSVRDALSIADIALSYNTGKLKYLDVMEILGTSNTDVILKLIQDVINSDVESVLLTIHQLSSMGKSVGMLMKYFTAIVRDLIVVKTCQDACSILALPEDKFLTYKKICDNTSEERLLRILDIFSDAEGILRYSNHPQIVFESSAIKASRPEADYNIDALLSRIKTLEDKLNNLSIDALTKIAVEEKNSIQLNSDNEERPTVQLVEQTKEKLSLAKIENDDLKGKLLLRLRQIGSEMLWNVIQQVGVSVLGNVLVLTAKSVADQELLDRMTTRERIEEALDEFMPFELQVKLEDKQKELDAIDDAADKIKSIFGDDIVIIK